MKNIVPFCAFIMQVEGAIPEQEIYYDTDKLGTVSNYV